MSVKSDSEPGGGGSSVGTGTLVESGGGGIQGPPPSPPSSRSPCGRLPKRWRLGYLVARCPKQRAVVCMVCSQALPMANASTFRQHIREHHPETATLSRPERRALADRWTKRAGVAETTGALCQSQEGTQEEEEDKEIEKQEGSASDGTGPGTPRHGQHAGMDQHCKDQQSKDQQRKDQQRKYQERWRMEYLMEYNSQRRGLVCVVCGATLATLKVSTIKRHIQQVHPQTLGFSPAQREDALRNFSHPAVAAVALPASPLRTPGSPPGGGQERE